MAQTYDEHKAAVDLAYPTAPVVWYYRLTVTLAE